MANYGVAVWFAVLSMSPAICHEHADGEADHSHGYGFFSLSPLLASNCSPESELAPHSRHYHLVLFGVEITLLPGCAALETGILHGQINSIVSWSGDLGEGLVAVNPSHPDCSSLVFADNAVNIPSAISLDSSPLPDFPTSPCATPRALRSSI